MEWNAARGVGEGVAMAVFRDAREIILRFPVVRYGAAILLVLAASLVALPLRGATDPDNLTMIYFTAVVVIALRLGLGPAITGSVASVALFNFLFTPPYYSFEAINPASYITFGIMLVSSLLAAVLTSGLSHRLAEADQQKSEARLMLDVAQALSAAVSRTDVEVCLSRLLSPRYRARVTIEPGPPEEESTPTMTGRTWRLPLAAGSEKVGALLLERGEAGPPDPSAQVELLTVAALAAQALLRIRDGEAATRALANQESERLRNVLLSSLSHDLRTPLTVLSGTVASLARMRRRLPRDAMDEVAQLTRQINRLQVFTGNLLKMAAISAGQLKLTIEPYALPEIVGAALQRFGEVRSGRQIRTTVRGDIPMVSVDGALIDQVISNLVDNAIQHTEPDGTIVLELVRTGSGVRVSISDDGPGLAPGDEAVIFERFRTGDGSLSDRKGGGGHGLGLAICRGIVEAHGGTIDARNNPSGRGACFSFTLPVLPGERNPS